MGCARILSHETFFSISPVRERFACFCWCFNERRVVGACQWDVIRHCVRSKLVRVDGQFRIACTYRTSVHRESPSMALWSNSQSPSTDCADWTPAQFFKQATGPESSGDECGILEDDRCIDKQESLNNPTSYTNWCSPAVNPRRSSHRSATLPDSSRLVRRPDSGSV